MWDTGLRCVWVNDALERYDGIARERRLGRRPRESLTGDTGEEVGLRRVGRALTRGASSLEDLGTAVIGTVPAMPPPDDVTLLLARGL